MADIRGARVPGATRRIGISALAIVGALAFASAASRPSTALAHVPILEQPGRHDVRGSAPALFPNAQRIESPTKSLALYGYVAPDETLDAFEFVVPVETSTTLDMLVPVRADFPDFRPTLTLFGDDAESPIVIVDPGTPSRSTFFEPFSLSNYYQGGSAAVALHPGVRYFLVVEPGTGTDRYGPYTIGVSGGEQFTSAETLSTLVALPTIWLGSWAGAPALPGPWRSLG